MKKKIIVAIVALVLAIVCAVGGTLAWLSMKTDAIVNTFTYGDINIDLWEHKIKADGLTLDTAVVVRASQSGFKMIPGSTIAKDPTVTVKADSEACWLFIKIEKSSNFDTFMTFEIIDGSDGWTALGDGYTGVYYRAVGAVDTDTNFPVLKDNRVSVKNTVLKTDLNALSHDPLPTLTFTAYAVQQANVADATTAWKIAENGGDPVTNP